MKRGICIILIIQALLLFASCRKVEEKVQEYQRIPTVTVTDIDLSGKKTNNDPIPDTAQKLPLSEYTAFFGEFSDSESTEPLSLEEIDRVFPATYLREQKVSESGQSYYIAYPVSEGGLYVVYLIGALLGDGSAVQLVYSESVYLADLPNKSDLASLRPGDPFDAVKQLAPATLLSTVRSSAIMSFSFLQDGTVAEIEYQKEVYVKNGELLIDRITFNDRNTLVIQEDLAYIS